MSRVIVFALLIMMTCGFSSAARAQEACVPLDEHPLLRVEIDSTEPVIDHDHSRAALKQFDIATISPYGMGRNVHIDGLMRSENKVVTEKGISWQRMKNGEGNCYWFDSIQVTMKLRPTIYVAKEIDINSCLYGEVLKHENKHYETNLEVAKDYQLVLQEEIEGFMHQTGAIGPFPEQLQEEAKQELIKRLDTLMEAIGDRMQSDRTKRQALLDTREEYERVSKACPGNQGTM